MKEKKDIGNFIFASVFILLLLCFSVANCVHNAPALLDTAAHQDFSHIEALQHSLNEIDTAMGEELLLRQEAVDLYGYLQLLMGKREYGGFDTLRDKDGYLYSGNFWNGFGDDNKLLAERTKRFCERLKAEGTQFGMIIYPMSRSDKRAAYYGMPYSDAYPLADALGAWLRYYGVPTLDLRKSPQRAGLTKQETFYKTDHHWTPLAAFYGYRDILDWFESEFGMEFTDKAALQDLNNYIIKDCGNIMFGSKARSVGYYYAGGTEPFSLIYPKEGGHYRLKTGKIDDYEEYEGHFCTTLCNDEPRIENKDDLFDAVAESAYLRSGVSAYDSIINENKSDGKKILILRDSYTTPVACFLAQSFSRIDLLWSKEYSPDELERIIESNGYDYVFLALYPNNISEDFFPFGVTENEE